ncbi:MAG: cyclic nucleotide-binding domain-containing protein [bacterium]
MEKDILRQLTFFYNFFDEELSQIASISELKEYEAGTIIFKEHEQGDKFFIIYNGKVRISRILSNGERQTLALLEKEDFFGELSFFDRRSHSATAEVINPTKLIVIEREKFDKLVEDNPLCGYKIMKKVALTMSSLLRDMNDKFAELLNYIWK